MRYIMNIKTNKTAETLAIQSEEQMKKDKRAKFIELGEKRMANAIKHIRLVGNLSDKNNYVYSDADAALMLKALRSELATTEAKFKNSKSAQTHTLFKFPGNK